MRLHGSIDAIVGHADAEVFDATDWQWLESAFVEDGMSEEDRARIEELRQRARERSTA